ncbi:MAG: hypothetical protein ABEH77_09045 [Halobacteriaceae archaeon]
MRTPSIDYSDAVVPLLTVGLGLGVAGASVATRSTPAAVHGLLASSLAVLAGFVGRVVWALYAAARANGTPRRRRVRSGAA